MANRPRKPRKPTPAPRAYVAFDYDKDRDLKGLVNAQAKQRRTKFKMTDTSLKEAAKESDWVKKAERRIKGSDQLIVMLGKETYKARGVKKEVEIARANDIPVAQVIARPDESPTRVKNAGRLYRWNDKNLKKILTIRKKNP